ncbi:MAG: 3-hydroxyacyl-CoA dehydrogenase [Pseudomonadota bacterium]
MKAPDAADYCIGVAGAGAMGQGIVQVAVQGGIRTVLIDAREGAAAAAKEQVAGRLRRLVEKGRMGEADAEAAIALIEPGEGPADFAPCDAVVEAVFEDLEVKRALFREIEAGVSADCIIASNTSSIPIASIARACEGRGRIAGLHFFNPVPLMKLVEVIRAAETTDATVEALTALGQRMTRVPVTVKDSPGFLVNMGGRAFTTEGLRIAHEQVASPAQIDAIMRDCRHFRMGPFELMDLTGIDVNYPVSQIVWEGYQQDPRLATRPNHKAMFDAGLLGRKTGQGWYAYEGGKPSDMPSPDHETDAAPAGRVAIAKFDAAFDALIEQLGVDVEAREQAYAGGKHPDLMLAELAAELGLEVGEDDGTCPILAAPFGKDATHTASDAGIDHRRLVCLDLSGDTSKRITAMTAPGADPAVLDAVASAIMTSGRKVTAIKDSPGFVGQRIVAMVANLGAYMAEVDLATPEDIDTAMKLGLNYPLGPLEFADEMGPARCLDILEQIHALTGEDRYRPTLWLRRRAVLGLPMRTPS